MAAAPAATEQPVVRRGLAGRFFALAAGAAVVVAAVAAGEFASFVVGAGFVYAVAVCGLHLVLNDTGLISLAHGAFVAVGAFAAAHVFDAVGAQALPLALPAAAGAAAIVGALVALPVLRMQGFTVAITTWLFVIAADRFFFTQDWFVGEAAGLRIGVPALGPLELATARTTLVVVGLVAGAAIALSWRVRHGRFGRSLYAVRSNEAMAASVGIDVRRTKVAVFAVGGAFAGVAGALWVLLLGRAVPSSFPPVLSVTFLAVAIIGGRGGLWGPVLAAFLFASGPELFGGLGRTLLYLSSLALVVVLVRFPGGMNEQGRHLAHLVRARSRR